MEDRKLISTGAAAERLDVSQATIRALIDAGELAGARIGRVIKVVESSLDAYLERQAIGARP